MTDELREKKVTVSANVISLVLQLLALAVTAGVMLQKVDNVRDDVRDVRYDLREYQKNVNDLRVEYNGRISVVESRLDINRRTQ